MLQLGRLIRGHCRAWIGDATLDRMKVSKCMSDPVLDQYQILVEDTARLSDRRQTVNNLYLSANSLLIGGVALLVQQNQKNTFTIFLILLIIIAGLVICYDWRRLINTYSELVKVRISMLKQLEDKFTVADLVDVYHKEDQLYDPKLRREQNKPPVFGFSRIERNLPRLFTGIYVLIVVGLVVLEYTGLPAQLAAWGLPSPK
jgi:hypothetical protein